MESLRTRAMRIDTPMGDGRIVWHAWGRGEPIVLLHGGSGSWTHWLRNIDALVERGHRVIIPDLPGFGDSDRLPEGDDADAIPPWIEAGLQRILGDDACTMVGFSFGAMVAGFIAARRVRRVERLILVGAPALWPNPMPLLRLRAWRHLRDPEARRAVHRHNLQVLMFADAAAADEATVEIHAANLRRDRLQRRRMSRTDVLLRTLPEVPCPVSGIWGAQDALAVGRLEEVAHALARAPRFQALEVVPAAGHWVQYEAAAPFDLALARLLA